MAEKEKPKSMGLQDHRAQSRYVRIYLDVDMRHHLDELMEMTKGDMKETEVCQLVVRAALRAMADNHYRLTLPLEFQAHDPVSWIPTDGSKGPPTGSGGG